MQLHTQNQPYTFQIIAILIFLCLWSLINFPAYVLTEKNSYLITLLISAGGNGKPLLREIFYHFLWLTCLWAKIVDGTQAQFSITIPHFAPQVIFYHWLKFHTIILHCEFRPNVSIPMHCVLMSESKLLKWQKFEENCHFSSVLLL